jgi:hypothetical protein
VKAREGSRRQRLSRLRDADVKVQKAEASSKAGQVEPKGNDNSTPPTFFGDTSMNTHISTLSRPR